jgi:uncharacterized membrane protein YdjX (TVP38/TMEM64 family)
MIKRHGKTAVRLAFSAALLGLFLALLWATYGTGVHAMMQRAATFYAFAADHAWLLVGLYVLRLPLFLPASLVIVLTGMICGPVQGELVAVAGLTLGGGIEFALVRASSASLMERWQAPSLLQQWRERIRRNPFHAILMMRLCFVPFDPVNIVAALAQVPLRAFLCATVLGVIPTSLPMVLSGASIDFQTWAASGRIWPGLSAIHWPYIAGSAAAAALIAWHASVRRRAQPGAPAAEPSPPPV